MLRYGSPTHSDVSSSNLRSSIEQLFIYKKFEEALQLTYRALLDLSEDRDIKSKGKTKQYCSVNPEKIIEELPTLHHRCDKPENCECIPIVSLLVQILYEMGKSPVVIPTISSFYGDMLKAPYDILFLCINLLVNALHDYMTAKKVLLIVLEPQPASMQGYRYDLTEEQREVLVELLLFHVMVPLEELKEAIAYLDSDRLLPEWKRQGWLDYLKATVDQNHKNKTDADKQEAVGANADKQVAAAQQGGIRSTVMNLAARSKNVLSYLLLVFRKSYQSRLGLLAYSAVMVFTLALLVIRGKSPASKSNGSEVANQGRAVVSHAKQASEMNGNNKKKSIFAGVGALLSEAFTFK